MAIAVSTRQAIEHIVCGLDIATAPLALRKGNGAAMRLIGVLLGSLLSLAASDALAQSSSKFPGYRSQSEAGRACGDVGVWVDIDRKTYHSSGQPGFNTPRRNGTFMCRSNAEYLGFAPSKAPNQLNCRRYGHDLVPYMQRRC